MNFDGVEMELCCRGGKKAKGLGKRSKGSKDMSGLRTNRTQQQAAEIKDEAVEKDDVQDVDTDATTETNTVVKSTRPQGRYKKRERGKLVHAYSSEDLGGILRDFLFYPPWAFGLPIWVLSIPLSLVESAIWISLTYYTTGFAPDTSRIIMYFNCCWGGMPESLLKGHEESNLTKIK